MLVNIKTEMQLVIIAIGNDSSKLFRYFFSIVVISRLSFILWDKKGTRYYLLSKYTSIIVKVHNFIDEMHNIY